MKRTNTNKKNTKAQDKQTFGAAVAVVRGTFTVDYEGEKYIFVSVKCKNDSNAQYYDIVNVRIPSEVYETLPRLENITLNCYIGNFFDKKKQAVITTLTAFGYAD